MNFYRFMNALMVCILACLASGFSYSKESLSMNTTDIPTRESIDERFEVLRNSFTYVMGADPECKNVYTGSILDKYDQLRSLFKEEKYKDNLNKTMEFFEEGYILAYSNNGCRIYSHNLLWRNLLDTFQYYVINFPQNEQEIGPEISPLSDNLRSYMYYSVYNGANSLYYACLYGEDDCSKNEKVKQLFETLNVGIEFFSKDNISNNEALFVFVKLLNDVGGIYPYQFKDRLRGEIINIGNFSLTYTKDLMPYVYNQTENSSVLKESSQLIANAIAKENDSFSKCTENLANLYLSMNYFNPPTLFELAYVDNWFTEKAMRTASWYYSVDGGSCNNNSIYTLVLDIQSKIRNKVKEKLSKS